MVWQILEKHTGSNYFIELGIVLDGERQEAVRSDVFTWNVRHFHIPTQKTKPINYKGWNRTEKTAMKLTPILLHGSHNSLLFGTSNMSEEGEQKE